MPVGNLCHFKFQGLQSAVRGHELRDLAVKARFFIDAEKANTVEKTAGPLAVDASGHAHATVTYPSMLEIWPEVCIMDSIRVMEVRLLVDPTRTRCVLLYVRSLKVFTRLVPARSISTSTVLG